MNRQTIYRGQLVYETDILYAQRFAYEALGLAMLDLLGSSSLVGGLGATPTSPASLGVKIAPGRIYALENLESTPWGQVGGVGGLNSDTDADHNIVKQGLLRDATTLSGFAAPATTGQSINYLIEASFNEADANSVVLPFFNSSNPSVPWAGPGNSAGALTTLRSDQLTLQVKAGTAATTGSQSTPAPDAGFVGLYVVTVANGQTTITSGNIALYPNAPFISESLTQKISQATGDSRYLKLTNARTKLTADTTFYVSNSGSDPSGDGSSGNPWATFQKACNVLAANYDAAGFKITIQQQGTGNVTTGVTIFNPPGITSPQQFVLDFNGQTLSPATNTANVIAQYGAQARIQNVTLVNNNTNTGLTALNGGTLDVGPGVTFGQFNQGAHIASENGGIITLSASYTISGGADFHYYCIEKGSIVGTGIAVTLSGTPAFTNVFALCNTVSAVNIVGMTFSGSATGARYNANLNGVINTNGLTLPGNSSGTTATGGQYA